MDEVKSKSEKKREAHALQQLGVEFVTLRVEKIMQLPLPPHVLQAIIAAKSLKSHGAIRRQAQWIGKMIRTLDSTAIVAAYKQMQAEESAHTTAFHELELWRSRLINEGKDALTDFIALVAPQDIQSLRHHIKKAIEEKQSGENTGASKALFRHLKDILKHQE